MELIARGVSASRAMLAAVILIAVMAPAATAAEPAAVQPGLRVAAMHAANEAGADIKALALPASAVCSAGTACSDGDHWFDSQVGCPVKAHQSSGSEGLTSTPQRASGSELYRAQAAAPASPVPSFCRRTSTSGDWGTSP
jgi:hypothetical protein